MKKFTKGLLISFLIIIISISFINCKKSTSDSSVFYNLDVILTGSSGSGTITFRQDSDTSKIVTLNVVLHNMLANHEYKLQRAVDTTLTGLCPSSSWLTLGKGTQPQSITTDATGNGNENLYRSLAAFPHGKIFDIHFQVIDAQSLGVILTSSCYRYMVR